MEETRANLRNQEASKLSGKTIGNDTQDQESTEDSHPPPSQQKEEVVISPIPVEEEKKKEPAAYMPKPPYPQRLRAETKDKQFSKFLEMFKKLQINILFAEA
ncbi:hypothetical protein PIB30_100002 [Stylosanthes scabra]|uniref:Uncharacterized protein n=1 Tax=Stylosanthes scabra TaxID=79078 RepID=A0ABU6WZP0_9FABA|nr:hypothetical protein [Stylosanthes scabra]